MPLFILALEQIRPEYEIKSKHRKEYTATIFAVISKTCFCSLFQDVPKVYFLEQILALPK